METVAPGLRRLALRTPTLPPATHTNTWVVGQGQLSLFDPATPYDDERKRLLAALEDADQCGESVERLVLTHHHHDHVGGAVFLKQALGGNVPIVAHPLTADLLLGEITVDLTLDEGDVLDCGGRSLDVHHTPGHAPGHLVFRDQDQGWMVAGDMVAGVGTIAISPEDGHLGQYLDSLQRMIELSPTLLLPAHGDPLPHPETVLSFYIAHRNGRTDQFRRILESGHATALEIAEQVYEGQVPPAMYGLAAIQVTSHLIWLQEQGFADCTGEMWRLVR